eukprot:EG_transcript_24808
MRHPGVLRAASQGPSGLHRPGTERQKLRFQNGFSPCPMRAFISPCCMRADAPIHPISHQLHCCTLSAPVQAHVTLTPFTHCTAILTCCGASFLDAGSSRASPVPYLRLFALPPRNLVSCVASFWNVSLLFR